MGSGISRTGSGNSRPAQAIRDRRRRTTVKHTISSFLLCRAASISRQMEGGYPNELQEKSVENGHSKKMKFSGKNSSISLGNEKDLTKISTESMVSSGRHIVSNEDRTPNIGARDVGHENNRRHIVSNEDRTPNIGARDVGHENKGKCLTVNVHGVHSHQSIENTGGHDAASTSYLDRQSPYSVSINGMSEMDYTNGVNCKMNWDSPEIDQGLDKSSTIHSPCDGEPLLDEISDNYVLSDQVDFSNSDHSYASSVSGLFVDHHMRREDLLHEVTPSFLDMAVSEMEHNQHDEGFLQVDVGNLSSNVLPTSSTEVNTGEVRRNSRRILWDAFSRRSSRNHRESRTFVLSPGNSGPLIGQERFLDSSGRFYNDETDGNSRSLGNRSPRSNELRWHSRPEVWETFRARQGSTHLDTAVCPAGIHNDGLCSCTSLSAEESGPRAGVSRIVMLAEALFEVLDQIHQHPMTPSLSVVSLPAPESVVDSFPVKTHSRAERLESAEDVSQCYICLAEYEEGDRIRVLPCHHEFHLTCVDKWLKEVHGVCPLCRGHIGEGVPLSF